MSRPPLKIGISTPEEFRRMTRARVRGEVTAGNDGPKTWFESLQSAAQVLGGKNRALLQTILEKRPIPVDVGKL